MVLKLHKGLLKINLGMAFTRKFSETILYVKKSMHISLWLIKPMYE
jgi:hypothetical protein